MIAERGPEKRARPVVFREQGLGRWRVNCREGRHLILGCNSIIAAMCISITHTLAASDARRAGIHRLWIESHDKGHICLYMMSAGEVV